MAFARPRLGLYKYWAAVRDLVRQFRREGIGTAVGGYWNRSQMEAAACSLAVPSADRSLPALEVHFLTGRGFWYQTLFCAWSLAAKSGRVVRPVLYDDGTLERRHCEIFGRLFPEARIWSTAELTARLDTCLPADRFPYLRQVKLPYAYPHIGKLTNVHGGSEGWKLVLDSDMLFYRKPGFLMDWLERPAQPLFMWDVRTAYGYSGELMQQLTGFPPPDNINVGVCGLKSDAIDWDRLEHFCATLVEKEGQHYFLEQALTAMLASGNKIERCPNEDYIVFPSAEQVRNSAGVLHHYTAESKIWYFKYGWKTIVQPGA